MIKKSNTIITFILGLLFIQVSFAGPFATTGPLPQPVTFINNDVYLICNNCSLTSMKNMAAREATTNGIKVHVISKPNRIIRTFHAELISEPEINFYRVFIHQLSTDSNIIDEINDALDIRDALIELTFNGTPIDNLPGIGPDFPGSALDLPNNSNALHTTRLAIQRLLGAQNGSAGFFTSLQTFVSELINDMLGTTVTIVFPDGSTYKFKITSISLDAITKEVKFEAEAVSGSGTDGEGHAIPETIGDLNNMNIIVGGNPNSGNMGNINGWIQLIGRLGGGSISPPSSSSIPTALNCITVGNSMICSATEIPVNGD